MVCVGPRGGSSVSSSPCNVNTLLHSVRCHPLSQIKIISFVLLLVWICLEFLSKRIHHVCLAVALVLTQPFYPSATK